MPPLSNLDLVAAVDTFPYTENPTVSGAPLYALLHSPSSSSSSKGDIILGYMLPSVVSALLSLPKTLDIGPVRVDHDARTIRAFDHLPTEALRSAAVDRVMKYWYQQRTFKILSKWRDEPWPVYSSSGEIGECDLLYNVERPGAGLLGVMRYGVHMNGYVKMSEEERAKCGSKYDIKLWIPKRSATKTNYPNMLDNMVAGGLMTGEDPFECMIREADEEADLPKQLMKERCKPVGTIVYISTTDERAGGERDLIYPETQWVFDIELPAHFTPKPKDGEVAEFYLWTVEETQAALAGGKFKPNCAVILIDFFMRNGILTRQNEKNYDEIERRMHRKTPIPGPHQQAAPTIS